MKIFFKLFSMGLLILTTLFSHNIFAQISINAEEVVKGITTPTSPVE